MADERDRSDIEEIGRPADEDIVGTDDDFESDDDTDEDDVDDEEDAEE